LAQGGVHVGDARHLLQHQVARANAHVGAVPKARGHGVAARDIEEIELDFFSPVAAPAAPSKGVVRHNLADAPERVVVLPAP
nr:hypothetical protein [Tanacetum cinerariifolium]